MSLKKTLLKNSFFNLASYAYLLLAAFFSIPIILRSLGADVFGLYIILASIVPLVSVLDLGLNSAVVRELSLSEIKRKDFVSVWRSSFTLYLLTGFIITIGVFIFLSIVSPNWPIFRLSDAKTTSFLSLIIPLTALLNHLNIHLLNLPQAKQRFEIYNLKTIIVGTGNTFVTALATVYTRNLGDLFLIQLIFHTITFVLLVVNARVTFTGLEFFPGFDKSTINRLVRFGLKNFVGSLSNQVEAQMSKYVIGASAPAIAITAFSIPQNLIMKGAGVVSQVSQVIFPTSTSLLTRERLPKLKKLIWIVQGLTFVFGLVGIFIAFVFGQAFLTWWLKDGQVVRLAVPVIKILSFYFLLTSLTPIPGVILVGLNYPQVPSFFSVLTTVIEIVLLFYLVPTFHAVGAAMAILMTTMITVPLFLLAFAHRFQKYEKSLNIKPYIQTQ